MGKENLMFRGNEVENDTFYRYKRPIFLEDADIKNVLISDKISFCEKKNYKHFIAYLHDDYRIKPLHIMLLKTCAYVRSYDTKTKWVYFLIENDNLLKKYNTI